MSITAVKIQPPTRPMIRTAAVISRSQRNKSHNVMAFLIGWSGSLNNDHLIALQNEAGEPTRRIGARINIDAV